MITSLLAAAIVAGTPLLFATLGELLMEKVGNLNLGVEGMMIMGAVIGFSVSLKTGSPGLALLGACVAGGAGALIYAILCVTLKANQVVTGLALTIFGVGFSNLVGQSLMGEKVPQGVRHFFQPYEIPLLSKIPYIGEIFFKHDTFVYIGYLMVFVLWIYMYKTRFGLNLRAVGENPSSADASGIRVNLYKYVHIIVGGALCGLGGAYLSLVYVPVWQENITAGRGWIAVALVIFASWNPAKAIVGAFLFGGLDILSFRLQKYDIAISQYLINMLPYVATIIALIFSTKKQKKENQAPGGVGVPYYREER